MSGGKQGREEPEDDSSFDGDVTTTIMRALQQQRRAKSAFTDDIKPAAKLHGKARGMLVRLFEDVHQNRKLDLHDARVVVLELHEAIEHNANLMLWLTSLRFSNERNACHNLNVAILAMVFGKHLNLSRPDVQALGLGGILHDVGKTQIPPLMLEKPAELSDAERAIVRKHVIDGFTALQASGELTSSALDIVRYHHERYDGSGYPEGLSGDKVPRLARIVSLMDAYDSMIGDYGYRQPLTPVEALHELRTQAGDEYGMELVQDLTRCLGTYPVGSLLELNSGAVVMVIASNKEARLKPLVMQLRNDEGKYERPRLLFDLSRFDENQLAESWGIKDALDPLALDLDVPGILVEEIMTA